MATPTSAGVVSSARLSGSVYTDALIGGIRWGNGTTGSAATVTYSFAGLSSIWSTDSDTGYGPTTGAAAPWHDMFAPFTDALKAAARLALAAWSAVANISFVEVADDAASAGDMRFAMTGHNMLSNTGDVLYAGYAYEPSATAIGGDVWLNTAYTAYDAPVAGTHGFFTLVHEIGHALGLKHPFEGAITMPGTHDNYRSTLMSYQTRPGTTAEPDFYPTTPMRLDIQALQHLYGARAHHGGDDTYSFTGTQRVYQTLYDTGGNDRILFNDNPAVTINLNANEWSALGRPITYSDGYVQKDTLLIAKGTVIEQAFGGNGADKIYGNAVANRLEGRNGNDTIEGGDGGDVLVGGMGRDILTGGNGGDWFDFNNIAETPRGGSGRDVIRDFSHAQGDKIDLRTIDADTDGTAGDQAFSFIGSLAFTGIDGQLRFSTGLLLGDTNGDRFADFEIQVLGDVPLASDILL